MQYRRMAGSSTFGQFFWKDSDGHERGRNSIDWMDVDSLAASEGDLAAALLYLLS